MAVYNSSINTHDEDSDITIINASIIQDSPIDEYVPIITRLKQANNSSENRPASSVENLIKPENTSTKNDYVFICNDPRENAKQLEQILDFYIRDLKKETNTQLHCDNQLVIRIMDLIRPAYPNDQQKMIALDRVVTNIADLHEKRHNEQREKIEELHTEICHLKKMLMTTTSQVSLDDEKTRQTSLVMPATQKCSINDYDQWTAIEDETKRLKEIVQSQSDRINEIASLVSQGGSINTDDGSNDLPKSASSDPVVSSLLQKVQLLVGHNTSTDTISSYTQNNPPLHNHSPGASPSSSLITLTQELLRPIEPIEPPKPESTNNLSRPNATEEPVLPPLENPAPPPNVDLPGSDNQIEPKKCPVCNNQFLGTISDEDMYDHIDNCLVASNKKSTPEVYECPQCKQKLPGISESNYLQHLTDCLNGFI